MQNEKLQCKRESTGVLHFTLLFFVFSFTFYVFLLPQAAQAGLIVNRPMYLGLTDGLVGYWSFDGPDMSQSTNNVWALDRSGQGNNGVLKNTATSSVRKVGKIGQGLSFDGSDDYVIVNTGDFGDTSPLSISVWINPRTQGSSNQSAFVSTSSACANVVVQGWIFGFYGNLGARGEICFDVDFTTTNLLVISSQNTVPFNQWQHLVLTWDGSGTAANAHIYRNGTEISYATQTNASGSRVNDGNAYALIGLTQSDAKEFDGLIDEVRIYNRALSAEEVRRLYNMGR